MANPYGKKYSTSLIVGKMQMKATMKFNLISFRMAIIKYKTNNKCWWGCGEKGMLIHYWSEYKLVQSLQKTVWIIPQNIKNRTTILWSNHSTTGYVPEENKSTNSKRYLNSSIHCSIFYKRQDTEAT